jgi:hypothetical protein
LAKELANCPNDQVFQERFFGGKSKTASINQSDVYLLVGLGLPYLKEVTANFIIRNIGAEAIKEDRWINEYLKYFNFFRDKLERMLNKTHIPMGLFDLVLWCYCEMFIHKTKGFQRHFDDLCSKLGFKF